MQVLECHNQKVSMHDPRGSVWCPKCVHYTILDEHGICSCCYFKVGLNRKVLPDLTGFEKIFVAHEEIINLYMKRPVSPDLEFYWPMRIGIINYLVPVSKLAAYATLDNVDDSRKFLDDVKGSCQVLGRGIHVVK